MDNDKREKKLPPESYIHRPEPSDLVPLFVRVPHKLKQDVKARAKKLKTSQNRYVEAALLWYAYECDSKS